MYCKRNAKIGLPNTQIKLADSVRHFPLFSHFFPLFPFLTPRAAPPQVQPAWRHFAPSKAPSFSPPGSRTGAPILRFGPSTSGRSVPFSPFLLACSTKQRIRTKRTSFFFPLVFSLPEPLYLGTRRKRRVSPRAVSLSIYTILYVCASTSPRRRVFGARAARRVGIAKT